MSKTYLLDRVLEERRSQREALRLVTLERIKRVLEEMSGEIAFDEAYIFGSVTKPYRFFEETDVDIGFLGLRDEDFFKALAYLSYSLERDVDIIQLEKHRLKEKVMKGGIRWTKQGYQY